MMKINVAIIDDSNDDIEKLKKLINDFNKEIFFNIDTYTNSSNVNIYNYNYNLYFLDIEMPNNTGIEVAKKINRKKLDSDIIFYSNREDLVFDSLTTNPIYFIRKSNIEVDLNYALNTIVNKYIKNMKTYKCREQSIGEIDIFIKDIMFVNSYLNYIEININNNKIFRERKTQKQFVNDIKIKEFINIHKSTIVNMSWISSIEKDIVTLKNGNKLRISRKHKNNLIENYIKYIGESL